MKTNKIINLTTVILGKAGTALHNNPQDKRARATVMRLLRRLELTQHQRSYAEAVLKTGRKAGQYKGA